jgi:c-di-GMP-binding flagellar brake protein YcgR
VSEVLRVQELRSSVEVPALLDSRAAVRFPLKLPITVRTADAREHFAETADISAGGVLFHTRAAFEVGATIRFRIVLPAAVLGTHTDVLVNCAGRIVRSSQENGGNAVAAVIDEYCFERVFSTAV